MYCRNFASRLTELHLYGGISKDLHLKLQLLVQQRPLLQDFSLQLLFVFVQQGGQLGGVLLGAFLLHHLFFFPFLSGLLLILFYLVEDELHYLVAHDHSEGRKFCVRRGVVWFREKESSRKCNIQK